MNNYVRKSEGVTSRYDESWWKSILNDEQRHLGYKVQEQQNFTKRQSKDIDWDYLNTCFHQDAILEVEIYGYNKGGLLAESSNFVGFVPNSHLNYPYHEIDVNERIEIFKEKIGEVLSVKIVECEPDIGKLILSERAAEKEEGCRLEILDNLEIGDLISGVVTNITKFGIFVDLGGVEGLVHISEISWGKVHNPANLVSIGSTINTKVIAIDREKMRIALSIKQLKQNPWLKFAENYDIGDTIIGKITKIVGYGFFLNVESGIEGLVHSTDIFDSSEDISLKDFYIGDRVEVSIKSMDVDNRRLSLGYKKRVNQIA